MGQSGGKCTLAIRVSKYLIFEVKWVWVGAFVPEASRKDFS
jgi:hypothetical protein